MIVKITSYKNKDAKGKITHYSDNMKIYSWSAPKKKLEDESLAQ